MAASRGFLASMRFTQSASTVPLTRSALMRNSSRVFAGTLTMNASKSVEVNETGPLTTKGTSAWAACPGRADNETAATAASSAKLLFIASPSRIYSRISIPPETQRAAGSGRRRERARIVALVVGNADVGVVLHGHIGHAGARPQRLAPVKGGAFGRTRCDARVEANGRHEAVAEHFRRIRGCGSVIARAFRDREVHGQRRRRIRIARGIETARGVLRQRVRIDRRRQSAGARLVNDPASRSGGA